MPVGTRRLDGHEGTMSIRIGAAGRVIPAPLVADTAISPPGRATRVLTWTAAAGIAGSILIMIGASLLRSSWSPPPLGAPGFGPPWALQSVHVPVKAVAVALWLAAILGGGGVAAGLTAVRRGARFSVRALAAAVIGVAALTVLPPTGSTDALDYASFGRIVVLDRTPYVMPPYYLRAIHDPLSPSIPLEWDRHVTLYGPLATAEQYAAATLGGSSMARIVFWLKLWNSIAFGAVALVADRLLRSDPASRLRAHLLWTINPLLLWGLIAGGHLDVLAAAAGLLGLVVVAGWPLDAGLLARGRPVDPGPLRSAGAGLLVGMAADIKISYVLFALGLAWALRRSAAALLAAAGGALVVLLPTYAWFGPPSIKAVLSRSSNTTVDNFFHLFSAPHHSVLHHHPLIAPAVVACLAVATLWRLPTRTPALPAIQPALALSVAWLFAWPYQLPWYDAMIFCLLVLYPASRLDWLVLARLTAGTIAMMPGSPSPLPGHFLRTLGYYGQARLTPVVFLAAAVGLLALCVSRRWNLGQADSLLTAVGQLPPLPADHQIRPARAWRLRPPRAAQREHQQQNEEHEAGQDIQIPGNKLKPVPVVLGEPAAVTELIIGTRIRIGRRPDKAEREAAQVLRLSPEAARPRAEHGDDRGGQSQVPPPRPAADPGGVAGQERDGRDNPYPVMIPADRRDEQAD
jgi:hypothetical protein